MQSTFKEARGQDAKKSVPDAGRQGVRGPVAERAGRRFLINILLWVGIAVVSFLVGAVANGLRF